MPVRVIAAIHSSFGSHAFFPLREGAREFAFDELFYAWAIRLLTNLLNLTEPSKPYQIQHNLHAHKGGSARKPPILVVHVGARTEGVAQEA